jgi:hypothetical protein
LPGDFNSDGAVDGADYVVWRKGVGTTYTQDDYNTWRANFGRTFFAGSGSALPSAQSLPAAVPEPCSLVLILLAASILVQLRTRARLVCGANSNRLGVNS